MTVYKVSIIFFSKGDLMLEKRVGGLEDTLYEKNGDDTNLTSSSPQ
jgi:hypothetical protein